jgi:hypothetical protein
VTGGTEAFRDRYFHIAGSASAKTQTQLIVYAHDLVREIARLVLKHCGGLVLFAGKEPRQNSDAPNSPSLLFDWTALEAAAQILGPRGADIVAKPSVVVVLSEKAESEIPTNRRQLWRDLLKSGQVRIEHIQPGARSGAMIRERQVQFGDALICIGGGTGVEHLAESYSARRKPVIPLDLAVGASREDGTGGALRLNREALANPNEFLRPAPGQEQKAGTLLTLLSTNGGKTAISELIENFSRLVGALDRPIAFYVRLLNPDVVDFVDVEKFFREVVDPAVKKLGYRRAEMGTDASRYGFINVEIFETLHYASIAIVDITGLRPNCFIELGYGLGRGNRVIVTAKSGTTLPFDQQAIPCFFWSPGDSVEDTLREFEAFTDKHLNRPPLVL